ncbi:MAG: hypothetical protein R3185_00050 [Candidatus Thermoplasmatota archaeon]|nr:hypothetical protein [Candidatus Thermoplasmatota archaeon]
MRGPARPTAWVIALMLVWVSLPADALDESFQCDAGNCDQFTPVGQGDCGGHPYTACELEESDRLACWEQPERVPPPRGMIRIPDPTDPNPDVEIEPGTPTPPSPENPPTDLLPDPEDLDAPQPCGDAHQACADASGGSCWVASLEPSHVENPWSDPELRELAEEICHAGPLTVACDPFLQVPQPDLPGDRVREVLCSGDWHGTLRPYVTALCDAVPDPELPADALDTADMYYTHLPAGTHVFAMGQPAAPWDYTLCVYDPDGTLHTDRERNPLVPDAQGGEADVTIYTDPVGVGVDARLPAGSLEQITVTAEAAGDWLIAVTSEDTCPSTGLAGMSATTDATALPGGGFEGPQGTLGSQVLEKLGVSTAQACAPHCAIQSIKTYCFGFQTIGGFD